MHFKAKDIAVTAMIAALYFVITLVQSIIFPGSTSAAIQFRASEAMMMLALFSPKAIIGLTIGCCIANITGGLPIDILIGSFATLLTGILIYATKKIKLFEFPVFSLLFPALCNGIIVGLEIQVFYVGYFAWTGFWFQFMCVSVEELAVSVILGIPFYYGIQKTKLSKYLK